MIQVNDLSLSFGGQQVFTDVNFNINAGERIGLVGRNGTGKTTIFRLLTGEATPDSGKITAPKNYSIGYLKQHLDFREPSILKEACLGLPEHEKDEVWRAEKMLMGLGFAENEFDGPPSKFSGGFQVRLNLAKVLLSEPQLLLLDEPTNYLDILSIRWLTGFLRGRENELVIITHDRDFMNAVSTHTMAIHRTKIKKVRGDTYKVFAQIESDEEHYEKSRVKEDKERKEKEAFINRFRAQAAHARLVQSRMKALEKMDEKQELAAAEELGFRFNSKEFRAKTHMRAEKISFGYEPGRSLIDGLDFNINRDDRICVIGKNGKGKSTLLRLLEGGLKPLAGEIKRHGNTSTGYFGQTNIERLNLNNTVLEELEASGPGITHPAARKAAGAMMFSGDNALKKISVLSGGERSRVTFAKILLQPVNLLLLDEPTNHLDMQSCESMIEAMEEFPGAIVIVTHSELFLRRLANRLVVFDGGKVFVFEGSYDDFLERVGWEEETAGKKKRKNVKKKNAADFNAAKYMKRLREKLEKTGKQAEKEEKLLGKSHEELAASYGKIAGDEIAKLKEKAGRLELNVEKRLKDMERIMEEIEKTEGGKYKGSA